MWAKFGKAVGSILVEVVVYEGGKWVVKYVKRKLR